MLQFVRVNTATLAIRSPGETQTGLSEDSLVHFKMTSSRGGLTKGPLPSVNHLLSHFSPTNNTLISNQAVECL